MDLVSFFALFSFAVASLWFQPLPLLSEIKKVPIVKSSELEVLTALLAAVHSARSFSEIWQEFKTSPGLSHPTFQRLESTSILVNQHGLSPTLLLQQIVSEASVQNRLQNKWREGISPAVTASVLLAIMPFPILLSATAGSLSVWDWILVHPIGRLISIVGVGLIAISTWQLRAANPFRVSPARIRYTVNNRVASVAAAFAVFSFRPDFFGGLLAIGIGSIVRTFWNQLTSKQSQLLEIELVKARPRVTTVLAVAVTAGASWDRAVDLAASEIPVAALEDWQAINQRIKWGVPVPQAFSEGSGDWQQIAVVVDQTLRTGAPLAGALFALSNYWQEASYSEQVNQIERKASRMVVLVTLLQLPAFILLGLVPLVAASLIPLFEIFLSTTA